MPPKSMNSRTSNNNKKKKKGKGMKGGTSAAPVAVASSQSFMRHSGRKSSTMVSNRELLATVSGSVGFSVTSFEINPGLQKTFAWLSQESLRWEQYRFHKLSFMYVTRSSTAMAGSVILSPEYDSEDLIPTDEVTVTNTQDAVESTTWKDFTCYLDPKAMFPTGPRKWIRQGLVAGNVNLYDVARLNVATIGQVDSSAIGKLWCEYTIEFFVPQTAPPPSILVPTRSVFAAIGEGTETSTGSSAINVGENWVSTDMKSALGIKILGALSNIFAAEPGWYRCTIQGSAMGVLAANSIARLTFGLGNSQPRPTTQVLDVLIDNTTPGIRTFSFSAMCYLDDGVNALSIIAFQDGTQVFATLWGDLSLIIQLVA